MRIAHRACLWEHEHSHLLSLVAHYDVWFVRIPILIQHISIQSLSLEQLIFDDDLVLDTGVGEALAHGLHDALFERVVLGHVLLETHAQVEIFTLQANQKALVGNHVTQMLG